MDLKVLWFLPRARQRPVLLAKPWALAQEGWAEAITGWLMGSWGQKEMGEGLKRAGPRASPATRPQRSQGLVQFFWDHVGKPRLILAWKPFPPSCSALSTH